MRSVRVIEQQGQSSLIEWTDDETRPRRSIVPRVLVLDDSNGGGLVDDAVLYRGIRDGSDWERAIGDKLITQRSIADSLRTNGFWTWRDIEQDPTGAQRAIDNVTQVRAATLARLTKQMEV